MVEESRIPRRRRLLGLLLALSTAAATAEPAFLLRSPEAVSGIGILGYSRSLSGQKAEYTRPEAAGLRPLSISPSIRRPGETERRISVVYTRGALAPEPGWTPSACAGIRLLRIPARDGVTLLYTDEAGYSLLFSFEDDFAPRCAFCASFVKGFRGFLPYATSGGEAPFPAVVNWE